MVDPYYVQGMADDGYGDDDAQWDAPGHIEKEAGMAEALESAREEYREEFRAEVERLAAIRLRSFTSEDVTYAVGLPRGYVKTNGNNAVGALMNSLARQGVIVRVGTETSKRPSSHAAELAIWTGAAWAKAPLAERQVDTLRRIVAEADALGKVAVHLDVLRQIVQAKR